MKRAPEIAVHIFVTPCILKSIIAELKLSVLSTILVTFKREGYSVVNINPKIRKMSIINSK